MATTLQLSQLAAIAQASYASIPANATTQQLIAALQEADGGFTPTQAQGFAANQSVVLQYNDDAAGAGGNGSSLSVTVFKDTTGNLSLAIRGTLDRGDIQPTDSNIALWGAGYDQIAALYC